MVQLVKNPPARWETWVWSLGWEDPLEKRKATHASILAWRIPWTEEAGGLQPVVSQKSQTQLSDYTTNASSWLQRNISDEYTPPWIPSCFFYYICLWHHSGLRSWEKNDLPCVCRKRPLPMQEGRRLSLTSSSHHHLWNKQLYLNQCMQGKKNTCSNIHLRVMEKQCLIVTTSGSHPSNVISLTMAGRKLSFRISLGAQEWL